MKSFLAMVLLASAAAATTPVWAQDPASASGATSTDSIVQMRTETRAAWSAYRAKVRAADRVRDRAVAKARAERIKAIEGARAGVDAG